MDASLCKRLALAFNTPYFQTSEGFYPGLREEVTDEAISAYTFDELSDDLQQLIEKSEASVQTAIALYPTKQGLMLTQQEKLAVFRKVEDDYKQKQTSGR